MDSTPAHDDAHARRIAHWIEEVLIGSPLARRLGLRLEACARDRVRLRLPYRDDNVTLADMVHGGAIATLIDVAGAAAAASGIDPEHTRGATASMNVHYLSAALGVDALADAAVLRRGRDLVVTEVKVSDASGKLLAQGTVVSKLG